MECLWTFVRAGKSYVVKLVANGKEYKTGKTKKDGSIGDTLVLEGSVETFQAGKFFSFRFLTHTYIFQS